MLSENEIEEIENQVALFIKVTQSEYLSIRTFADLKGMRVNDFILSCLRKEMNFK